MCENVGLEMIQDSGFWLSSCNLDLKPEKPTCGEWDKLWGVGGGGVSVFKGLASKH